MAAPRSALAGFVAALLPPEAGGPDPDRVAAVARQMIDRMPAASQVGLGAALAGLEGLALASGGRRLGALTPERRQRVLARASRLAGPALDAVKTIALLANGAESFAAEIAAVGSAHPPSRPDPELDLVAAAEWPERSRCEAIVIGSGAGGAFAARELARAGLETVIVEEGERWDSARLRAAHPLERFAGIYRDGGATMALGDPPIALPMGRAVGGTTAINSGTCYRPPLRVATAWHEREGLALAGAAALGWEAAPLRRNATGCRGACQCAIGCPNNAKGGVHLNALPQACEAGARIVAGLHVDRVVVERGRATGVEARRPDGRRVWISAPIVVVAAGAIPTPPLLRRSGLGGHPRLGRGLSIHPALGVTASFEEEVVPWRGVMQSVGIEELHERDGILIEATSTPPGMGAVSARGYGRHLVERLAGASHTATIGAMIGDAPAGRVFGRRTPLVTYRLTREDRARLVRADGAVARVLLAAGAREVELGGGAPPVRSEAEIDLALERLDVRRLRLIAFHPTGTAAAGADPSRHPVDPHGRLRGVTGVWVADASILPSCPSVNPQVSVMALAAGVGAAAVP